MQAHRIRAHLRAFAAVLLVIASTRGFAAVTVVPAAPKFDAKAYILLDYSSGRVLAESNADERVAPASLTKMMTVYVVFSELKRGRIKLDDMVRISKKAWRMPGSRMFVKVGSRVSVKNLLHGVIIQSGNDASVALAEYVAGDETAFTSLMNQYAKHLGMTHTHYMDASGLPHPDHYTTARDLSTLAHALIRDFPDYYKWDAIKQFTWNGITQYNRNKLLWRDNSVDGIKTGHTEEAGYCLVASAKRGDMRLISVVMGTPSAEARAVDSDALLRYGFRFFETHRLYTADTPLTTVRVWKGATEHVGLGLNHDLFVTVPRGQYGRLDAKMKIDSRIVAPVASGQVHGQVRVALGGKVLAEQPLVALGSVAEGNLWRRMSDRIRMMFNK